MFILDMKMPGGKGKKIAAVLVAAMLAAGVACAQAEKSPKGGDTPYFKFRKSIDWVFAKPPTRFPAPGNLGDKRGASAIRDSVYRKVIDSLKTVVSADSVKKRALENQNRLLSVKLDTLQKKLDNAGVQPAPHEYSFWKMVVQMLAIIGIATGLYFLWQMALYSISYHRMWDKFLYKHTTDIKCLAVGINDHMVIAKALIKEDPENPVIEIRKFDVGPLKGIININGSSFDMVSNTQVFVLTVRTRHRKKEFLFSKGNPADKKLFAQQEVDAELAENLKNKIKDDPFFQAPPFRAN